MTSREYLFHLELHGIKLGLENIRNLLDAAGNPQDRYPAVHVAGTNGKGSVVATVDAIARAAGYTVGRFTSPHLIDVTERFIVNGMPMPGDALDDHIRFFRNAAEHMDASPTFFELNTAVAFRWFAECGVDLAIIEVGMGGRLDSTNVIAPIACAITNIDFDHMQYLGDTLEKIAYEKAGIIKQETPVVIGETHSPAREILLARATELDAPVYLLNRDFQYRVSGDPFAQQIQYDGATLHLGPTPLRLAGRHQADNAAVAVALAERMYAEFPRMDARAIVEGLGTVRWPCRLEQVLERPPVIVDAAHNPAGAQRTARTLKRCVTLLSASGDKDVRGMIDALAPITATFIFSQYSGGRALPAEQLAAIARAAGVDTQAYRQAPSLDEAIEIGLALASNSEPLLITGSIFTAGEARTILQDRHGVPPLRF